MSDLDYQKLKFMCGVEIHQQLDTGKLFCRCPSVIREEEPDLEVERGLRAVAGELGDVDPAALHEFLRDRRMTYQAYCDTTCLVELDEEPPRPMDEEALRIVLEASLLLNARPVDELQVMRKTVIDGSNTSGFQRTVLAALDGSIETSMGPVGIPTICLEEDAARKISEEGNKTVYRLDRLGIPLIEIGTAPDIKDPAHAKEVAEKLGMILRATGKVKRGLGTIRQDLNVSILGGQRIEVKGVQDLRLIPKIVEGEVRRQLMLIETKEELSKRGLKKEDIKKEYIDLSGLFASSQSKVVSSGLKAGGKVIGMRLPGFCGLLKGRMGPELAQYVRAKAGLRGLFHSDELPAYGITAEEVEEVKKELALGTNDAFALVCAKDEACKKALDVVAERAVQAFEGIPKETRKASGEGATEYMRPLPGSARMYPETDQPPVPVGKELIDEIKSKLSELPEEKAKRYVSMGLSEELAGQMVKSRWNAVFDAYVKEYAKLKPALIATTLIAAPKEAKKRFGADEENLGEGEMRKILSAVSEKKVGKDSIPELLAAVSLEPQKGIDEVISEKGLGPISAKELEDIIDAVISANPGKPEGFLFGRVMAEARGRADAGEARKLLAGKMKK